jgi:hypothetical protein
MLCTVLRFTLLCIDAGYVWVAGARRGALTIPIVARYRYGDD